MRTENGHRTPFWRGIRVGLGPIALVLVVLVLASTCDLFKPGLGSKVDITKPDVSIRSPGPNAYLHGDIILSGTADDDQKVQSLFISYAGVSGPVSKEATLNGKKWSITVPSGSGNDAIAEGQQTFTATVSDNSGKTSAATLTVFVDNQAPTVLVTSPSKYGTGKSTYSNILDISGEVYDASPIEAPIVQIVNSAGTVMDQVQADGTHSWTARFTLDSTKYRPDNTVYHYLVTVRDQAGNVNKYVYHRQDILTLAAPYPDPITHIVQFPSTNDIGKVDQGGTSAISYLTRQNLDPLKVDLDGTKLLDFVFNSSLNAPTVTFTNVTELGTIGTGTSISGFIKPGITNTNDSISGDTAHIRAVVTKIATSAMPNPPALIDTNLNASVIQFDQISSSVSFVLQTKDLSNANLSTGTYTLKVHVVSDLGEVTDVSIDFSISGTAPQFTSISPANSSFVALGGASNNQLSMSVTVKGANSGTALDSIQWKYNDQDETHYLEAGHTVTVPDPPSSDTIDGSGYHVVVYSGFAFTIPDTTKLGVDVKLVATDDSGIQVQQEVSYRFDSVPPTIEFTSVLPMVSVDTSGPASIYTVNGTITAKALVSDDSGLASVTWRIYPDSNSGTNISGYGPATPASLASPSLLIDTTKVSDDGVSDASIEITAVDRAGNQTIATQKLHVDQATDKPVITFGNLDSGINTLFSLETQTLPYKNLFNAAPKLSMSLTDDDGLDPASIQASLDGASFVGATTNPPAKTIVFDYDLSSIADGTHYISFKASDDVTKKTAPETVQTATSADVYFMVDSQAPVHQSLTIDASALNLGTTYRMADFTLGGTVTDNVQLASVSITRAYQGGSPLALSPITVPAANKTNYTWSLPQTGLADGTYEYVITVRDMVGNSASSTRTVFLDKTPPTAAFTGPAANTWQQGATLTVNGSADDGTGSGVQAVYVWAGNQSATAPTYPSGWTAASGTGSWNAVLDISSGTGLGEGSKKVEVIAVDRAGLQSVAYTLNFGVDQSAPTANETSVGSLSASRSALFTLGGTSDDSNALQSIRVTESMNGGSDLAVPGSPWSLSGTSASWTTGNLPMSGLVDGVYTYKIVSTDIAGKTSSLVSRTITIDTTPPTVAINVPHDGDWLVGNAATISGTASDAVSGPESVWYWVGAQGATPPSGTAAWTKATGASAWSATLDLSSLGEGSKTLWIKAKDNAGNVTSDAEAITNAANSVNFGIDQTPPSIVENTIGSTTIINTPFTIGGTAEDSDALAHVTITQSRNGASATTILDTALSGTSTPWSLAGLPSGGLGDGSYTYVVTARDVAGKTASVTKTLTYDSTPPVVNISNPAAGNPVNWTITMNASASDANAVSGAKWWIGSGSGPSAWTDGLWTDFGAAPYTAGFDTSTLTTTSGTYTLKVIARDGAGNNGYATQTLTVDQSTLKPTAAVTSPVLGDYVNSNAVIRGTLSADRGLDLSTVAIQYSEDGGATWSSWIDQGNDSSGTTSTAIPGNLVVNGTNGAHNATFTYTMPNTSDGAKAFRVSVKDVASGDDFLTGEAGWKSASYVLGSVSFAVDTANPTLSVTSPGGGASYGNSAVAVSGTSGDANGVASVRYKVDSGTWSAAASSDSWATWSGTVASSDIQALSEGAHTLFVEAQDAAGKITSQSVTINRDISAPVVSFTNLATDGSTIYLDTVPKIIGTATDSGKVAALSATVQTSLDNGATWASVATNLDLGISPATTVNWSLDLSASPLSLADGLYRVSIGATDTSSPANNGSTATINFRVDRNAPALAINTPANNAVTNGTTLAGGTASDANLSAVNYKIDSGSWAPVTKVNGTDFSAGWSASITTAALGADGTHTLSIEALDLAGRTTDKSITIIRDSTAPSISFTNLLADGSTVLQDADPKAMGTISDASGIATMEYRLESSTDGGTSWGSPGAWTSLGTPSGTSASFSLSMGPSGLALGDGLYRISVRSNDISSPANTASPSPLVFRVDRNLPTLSLSTPASGTYQRAAFVIQGSASDANNVAVDYSVDAGSWTSAGAQTGSATFNYSTTVSGAVFAALSEGPHTLNVRATDGTGKSQTITRDFTKDTVAPSLSIIDPANGISVTGNIVIKGTTTDTNPVNLVELKIGKSTIWNSLSGVYNWQYSFTNIDSFANTTYATDIGDTNGNGIVDGGETWQNIWNLYIYVRATDGAGNQGQITTYILQLDPSLDKPVVNIYQPFDNSTVGGQVRVYGNATDNTSVFRVEMAFDVDNNGSFNDAGDVWPGHSAISTLGSIDPTAAWYLASGTTNWFQNINSDGEFNPPLAGTTKTIRVKVRAIDTKDGLNAGIAGDAKIITLTFNDKIPRIQNVQILKSDGTTVPYASGVTVGPGFSIQAQVQSPVGLAEIDLNQEGPLSGSQRIDNTAWATNNGLVGGFYQYTLNIPIDTTSGSYGTYFASNSGQLSLSLRAVDTTTPNPFQTYSYLTVNVDNIYASGTYTASTSIVGTAYKVQGTAIDTGTVSGVKKIVAYLERSGQVYNPRVNNSSTALSTQIVAKDFASGGSIQNVNFPTDANYQIDVDNPGELGVSDTPSQGDGDGVLESLTLSGNTVNWWGQINTTNIPDGPITIHYVIFDNAGNASHYSTAATISNFPPVLGSITIGTDVDGDGSVAPGEMQTFSSGYGASNFTVRNSKLYISVAASDSGATYNTLYYSFKYGANEQNGTLTNNSFTITNFAAIPDSSSANGAVFTLNVYDNTPGTPLAVVQTVAMNIKNIDTTPPTISVAPFGQKYNLPSPNQDGSKSLGAVSDYNENIVMNGSARLGHVEYAADSLFDGNDADVSGKVIFKGKAWDDQRISKITASIAGFDPDGAGALAAGAEFTIAAWGGSGLTAQSSSAPYWAFSLDSSSEAITQGDGHLLNWSFAWDSSQITGIAGANKAVTFKIYDYGPSGGNTASSATQVDVVPYVTSIQRTGGYPTIRSKYGRYPVSMVRYPVTNENLTVSGFNLKPGQDGTNDYVKIVNSPSAALTKADTTISDDLAYSAVAADYSSFTATLANGNTHSGWLRLKVNNVEATNNIDSTFASYDKEDDGSGIANTKWSNDRYLMLWSLGDTMNGTSGVQIQYPAMAQATNGNLYGTWVNYGAGSINYSGPSAAGNFASTPIAVFNDPEEFSDIYVQGTGTPATAANNISVAYLANTILGTTWATVDSGFLAAWSNNGTIPNLANNTATPGIAVPTNGNSAAGWAFERLAYNSQLWQFQKPKVARNGADLHVAYWDIKDNSIKYAHVTTTAGAVNNNVLPWINLDGGSDGGDVGGGGDDYTPALAGGTNSPGIGLVTQFDTTFAGNGSFARTGGAGTYLAMDIDPTNNRPVIVYYDITNSTLRLARASSAAPAALANWTIQPVFNSADSNGSFTGRDVSIKFDSAGTLYVSSYNIANGQLIELTGTLTGGKYVFGNSTVIDAGGSGTWSDVTTYDNGTTHRPYISYMSSAMIGTFNGVKMAYWDTSLASPDWETLTVPLKSATTDNRTNIEYNKAAGPNVWQVAIGVKTTGFDVDYLLPTK